MEEDLPFPSLLDYRAGNAVGKYVSLENQIEKTKATYYEKLERSDMHWNNEENDITPFIKYMLGTILTAYRDFEERVILVDGKASAIDLV